MTESTFTLFSGEPVHQRRDADGALVEQTCVRCGEWRTARKFPRRASSITGRGLKCHVCKRRQRAAAKKAAYAASHTVT